LESQPPEGGSQVYQPEAADQDVTFEDELDSIHQGTQTTVDSVEQAAVGDQGGAGPSRRTSYPSQESGGASTQQLGRVDCLHIPKCKFWNAQWGRISRHVLFGLKAEEDIPPLQS
jgi:hypothetical protein